MAATSCGEAIRTCSPQHRQNAALTFGPSQRTIVSSVSKVISTVCFMLQPFNDREYKGRPRLRYCSALESSGDFRSVLWAVVLRPRKPRSARNLRFFLHFLLATHRELSA